MATKRMDPQPLLHLRTAISDVNTCKVNVYKILELLVVYSHCKGRADAAGSHGRFLFLITFFVVGRQGTQFTYPGGHSSHTPETKFARGIKSCTPTRLQTRTGRGRSSESRRSRGTQSGTQSIGGDAVHRAGDAVTYPGEMEWTTRSSQGDAIRRAGETDRLVYPRTRFVSIGDAV
jgi:hypothetical protein